jgi:hypothetical protein
MEFNKFSFLIKDKRTEQVIWTLSWNKVPYNGDEMFVKAKRPKWNL